MSDAVTAHRSRRYGLTLVEVLVAISIIGILMALLLPAVQQSRGAARRNTCANNLRNVDLAMLGSAGAAGRFPASGWFRVDKNNSIQEMHSWVVPILPWIERRDVARLWDADQPLNSKQNQPLTTVHIALLVCPDDSTVVGLGDISYVVNGGIGYTVRSPQGVDDCPYAPLAGEIDLNGNGVTCPQNPSADTPPTSDRQLLTMLGMCFTDTWKSDISARYHTSDSVFDGLSQTFLLSENVRAGVNPDVPGTGWAPANAMTTSFFFSSQVCKSLKCSKGNVNYALADAAPQGINSSLTEAEGEAPWPSSYHVGDGVHFAFADGHVKFVSRGIDGAVYAALFSPQGTKLDGLPIAQVLVDDSKAE